MINFKHTQGHTLYQNFFSFALTLVIKYLHENAAKYSVKYNNRRIY